MAKRDITVASAGAHNTLMVGPPGSAKQLDHLNESINYRMLDRD